MDDLKPNQLGWGILTCNSKLLWHTPVMDRRLVVSSNHVRG